MKRCEPPCVNPDDLIAAKQVRDLASGRRHTPISRHTLADWRDKDKHRNPFPDPVAVLQGAGPGGSDVEIWSRTAVKDWLKRR
jgi:hypothetical protein